MGPWPDVNTVMKSLGRRRRSGSYCVYVIPLSGRFSVRIKETE